MEETEGFHKNSRLDIQGKEIVSQFIENKATVLFEYQVRPNDPFINLEKTSNKVITCPRYINLDIIETVEKEEVLVGGNLCYKIEIINTGNVELFNTCFSTVLPKEICFILDSVTINEVEKPNLNPSIGFRIRSIEAYERVCITFCVCVLEMPFNYAVYNQVQLNYNYRIDTKDIPFTATTFSNRVETIVKDMGCIVTKKVDKEYVQIYDYIGYEIIIQNTGNVELRDVSFKDPLCEAIQFMPQTVYIDGICYVDYNPNIGFGVKNMKTKESCTITFCVRVIDFLKSMYIGNTSCITLSYQCTQETSVERKTIYSNKTITCMRKGTVEVRKSVNKCYAMVGDELTYTLRVTNTGNIGLCQVDLIDKISPAVHYNVNSLTIDGMRGVYNPSIGIPLGNLKEKQQVIIAFSVVVDDLPEDNRLTNRAEVHYRYCWNPDVMQVEEMAMSNQVTTTIQSGGMKIIKQADKEYVNRGDTLLDTVFVTNTASTSIRSKLEKKVETSGPVAGTFQFASLLVTKEVDLKYATLNDRVGYTVKVFNNGNIPAMKVNFRDIMPAEMVFIDNSVSINGEIKPEYAPYKSFSLGTIEPLQMVKVHFKSRVKDIPISATIENEAVVIFAYPKQGTDGEFYKEAQSNKVSTQINYEELSIKKNVDANYATPGDIITYSFLLTNKGNIELTHVILTDAIQRDVCFMGGSVSIEDKPTCYDPRRGIPLGTIPSMHTVKVKFEVKVRDNPSIGILLNSGRVQFKYRINPYGSIYIKTIISNDVCTFLVIPSITVQKIVNRVYGTLLDRINYTIWIVNEGNTAIQEVFFKDILSYDAGFIEESVKIEDRIQKTLNPITGFHLSTIEIGSVTKVEFEAQIIALPDKGHNVINDAVLVGQYKINPKGESYKFTKMANQVVTTVRYGDISIVKCVSMQYAQVGDNLTYMVLLTHIGNVSVKDLCFFDKLDSAVEFIPESVVINDLAYPCLDPTIGFWIEMLRGVQQVKIQFDVKVRLLPSYDYIENKGFVKFNYKIDANSMGIYKTKLSNSVTTHITLGELRITQCCDKLLATVGEVIAYNIQIINTGNVKATHVYFKDILRDGIVVKCDSVKVIESEVVTSCQLDPVKGFQLNDIEVGHTVNVVFEAIVVMKPLDNKVVSQAELQFAYKAYPDKPEFYKKVYSNKRVTHIIIGEVEIIKQVDKEIAMIGEKLTYTISLINTGNTNAIHVYFVDAIPEHTVFVVASVYVKGVHYPEYHPEVGFKIGIITPGQIVKIMYQVHIK